MALGACPVQAFVMPNGGMSGSEATSIAVIGMSGRFPGARNVAGFWKNIREGRETIRVFTEQELLAAGERPELVRDPTYVKACGYLDGIDQFDAAFFGISPRDAAIFAILGVANNALYLGLGYTGLQTVSAGLGGLVVSANPVFTAVLAAARSFLSSFGLRKKKNRGALERPRAGGCIIRWRRWIPICKNWGRD